MTSDNPQAILHSPDYSNIYYLVAKSYSIAKEKGWWDKPRPVLELLALVHSEVSEAVEEYRDGYNLNTIRYRNDGKPEGFSIELADTLIRIFDLAGYLNLDLREALEAKMRFNETRPYRHGNKEA